MMFKSLFNEGGGVRSVDLINYLNVYRDAQQVLTTNLKRNPANQTEAIMQHELQRLTGIYHQKYNKF